MRNTYSPLDSPQTLLESKDVARLLDVTASYARLLARLNKIVPSARTPRGVRLFRAEDVLQLAAERRDVAQRRAR